MRKFQRSLFFSFILSFLYLFATAQKLTPDPTLEQEIIASGLIHSPLPVDSLHSFESSEWRKKIIQDKPIPFDKNLSSWTLTGNGSLQSSRLQTHSSGYSLRWAYPSYTGKRAVGSPDDPDYATYGNSTISSKIQDANWTAYNRIEFYVYPDAPGARVVNINLEVCSASHLLNLVNRQWNRCFLDLTDLPRDQVNQLQFTVSIKGKDRTNGDSIVYYIDQIRLLQVDAPAKSSGWQPEKNSIVYSTSGYLPVGIKTAIVTDPGKPDVKFNLFDEDRKTIVFTGPVKQTSTTTGKYGVLDFSKFTSSGNYSLRTGGLHSPTFRIGKNLFTNSQWRVLNFLFCQRCGYPVPGKHGTCHTDLCSQHDGKKISYAGGWHDAGDLSQQTLQTADVSFALLEAYNSVKNKEPLLAARLLEEAEWGMEFVVRNRYGDGYRASSMGLVIWQDGIINTLDDINSVRVQNLAFDNFLYAGYEAYAAMSINRDPAYQEWLQKIAIADFDFALKKHMKDGFGGFLHFYEHSYNTSESQYMATISWAASLLFKLTREQKYADLATQFIRYTLSCQRSTALDGKDPVKGFFYRDTTRKSIVHYIHQSREQVYTQALVLLCETQPNHSDYAKWAASIRLYGDYLKSLMPYTAPYGMVPSGIYHKDEASDSAAFFALHLFPPPDAKDLFATQVQHGVPMGENHFLKRFPVWFSIFNGNTAVILSTGKAAAICGHFLKDESLLQIGREQLYWTVGKNPFGQSLIHGEGNLFPQMDSFSSGEMTGEMPVGIRSLGNEDVPNWPQTTNATYKEVWVTSGGKWLSLLAEY